MGRRAFSRAAITRRLFNAPLAVTSETAAVVLGAIGQRFDVAQLFVASDGRQFALGELEEMAAAERAKIAARSGTDRSAPMASASRLMFVADGVAHVDIRGELVSENGIGPESGFTGYDGIRAQVLAADADQGVRGILMDIDCPGGEVADLYELVGTLMARRGTKPMRAMIRGMGASAAYAIAACADEITLNELGYAGSVGTLMMHADFSKKLENDGIAVTLIAAGEHKTDGNPFEPLPEDVAKRFAQLVNTANDRFIAHVATARGLSEDAVRAQQAQIYRGEEAVAAGLVDKVMSWTDSMAEFVAAVNGGSSAASAPGARSSKEHAMDPNQTAPAAVHTPEDMASARTEAAAAATTAERARITALAELDGESSISASLQGAIESGQSAGDFAIALAKASKDQQAAALTNAKADAVQGGQLPEAGARSAGNGNEKVNRGQAAVNRLRGKVPGLPAQA